MQTLLQLASLRSLDVMFGSVGQFLTPHTSRILIAILTPTLIETPQTREQVLSHSSNSFYFFCNIFVFEEFSLLVNRIRANDEKQIGTSYLRDDEQNLSIVT